MSWYEKPTLFRKVKQNRSYVFVDESGCLTDFKDCFKKALRGDYAPLFRDAVFSLNAVLISGKAERKLNRLFRSTILRYLPSDCVLHATDIDSWSGAFNQVDKEKRQQFSLDLVRLVASSPFIDLSFGMNKRDFFNAAVAQGCQDAKEVVEAFYRPVFLEIEKTLCELKRESATLVMEETTSELDMLILKTYGELKRRRLLTRCRGMYFSYKGMEDYPAGSELADITSKSMFAFYRNIELRAFGSHIYNHPKLKGTGIHYIDYKKPSKRHKRGKTESSKNLD